MLFNALGYINNILKSFNSMEESQAITNSLLRENNKYYYFDVYLSGCCKKDISMAYKEGVLTLTVIKPVDTTFNSYSGNIHIQKKGYERYMKHFFIGKNLDSDDITTAFSHGILRVAFPKKTNKLIEAPSQKLIEIQ